MDKKDLLNAIGEVDQELVEAAAPKGLRIRLRPRRIAAGTIAAACLLLAIFAVSGGWFKRETRPEETKLPSEVSRDNEETKKITGTSASTAPDPLPESTPAPASSESTPAPASSESTPASTETQAPVILYQKDGITVQEGRGGSSGSRMEAQLAYLTEQELFTQPLVMRAVLTDYKPLVITQEYSIFSDNKIYAALMSFEPISVLHGELPPGQETVKVFANYYTNTSLEDLSLSLRTAGKGREGIIMLYPMEEWHPEYMTQLADYVPRDNQRFAIWEMPGGGLSYDKHAFIGLEKSWTLDQAEAYARQLIQDKTEAPADFSFSFSYRSYGLAPEDTYMRSFDSASGLYSVVGTAHMEMEYGAENLETRVRVEKEILDKIYRALQRLKDMPEMLSDGDNAGGRETTRIEISWFAEGGSRRVLFSGSDNGMDRSDVNRLTMTLLELQQYLEKCTDMQGWQEKLMAMGDKERRARSEEIVAALEAAFAEKYGPGGKPEYFQLAEISEGGYLTLWLDPWSKEYQKEIKDLLPEEYRKGFLFGQGRGTAEQGSNLYDVRMGLVLGRTMQEREPRWQIIQEETFLKEPLENRLKLGYRYEDGRQSAWYSILLKGQEEEWEPFARLRMQLRVPGSEEGLLSAPITRRDDLEYAYFLSVCRSFRPIREEDRQGAGEPLAWIYYENQYSDGILLLLEDGRLMHSSGTYPERPLPADDSVDTVTAYYAGLSEADMLHLLAIGLWYTEERETVPQPEAASSEPGLRWR